MRWFLRCTFSCAFIAVRVCMDKLALASVTVVIRPCSQVWCIKITLKSAAVRAAEPRRPTGGDGPRSSSDHFLSSVKWRDALKLPYSVPSSLHPFLLFFLRFPLCRWATFRGARFLTSRSFPHFISRVNHVVPEPGPSKYRHGQAQSTPQQWRKWIRA